MALSAALAFFLRSDWTLSSESDTVQDELKKLGKKSKHCCGFSSEKHIPYLLITRDILGPWMKHCFMKLTHTRRPGFRNDHQVLSALFWGGCKIGSYFLASTLIFAFPFLANATQINYLCSTIALALFTIAAQKASKKIGRVPVMLSCGYIGIALGWTLAFG